MLGLVQEFGAHISVAVVDAVQAHREVFVVSGRARVGHIDNDAIVVGGDDAVVLIGDALNAVTHVERGSGHGGDGYPVGVEGRSAVLVEREAERLVASGSGRETIYHVARLACSNVGKPHRVKRAVNKHVNQVVARGACIFEVEVYENGFAVVQGALGGATVNRVFGR